MTDYPECIRALRKLASATPNTGEGSRGHLRDEFAWQVEADYRRAVAGNENLLGEPTDDITSPSDAIQACATDATNALARWTETDVREEY